MLSGVVYIPVFFLTISHTLSTVIIIAVSCLIMLTSAVKDRYYSCHAKTGLWLIYMPTLIFTVLGSLLLKPYQSQRLLILLTQQGDPKGYGYTIDQIRNIVSNAKPFGEAFIHNEPLEKFLPAPHTDFSFAFIIGKLGYVPAAAVALLLFFLLYRLYKITKYQKNPFGKLISLGGVSILTIQIALSLLYNIGIYTISIGYMPFISFGAIPFVFTMGLLGLILSVYRRTNLMTDSLSTTYKQHRLISFENNKLIIDLADMLPKKE